MARTAFKLYILLFYLLSSFITKANIDSLFLDASKTFHYNWSIGDHLAEQIIFHKDSNLFLHTFREHLLVVQVIGSYEIKDSSITMQCNSGCEERIKSLPPILVPTDTVFSSDTLPVFNSAMQLASNSYATLKKIFNNDSIIIYTNNEPVYERKIIGNSNSYKIIVPSTKDYYLQNNNYKKTGYFKNGNLILEGKLFPKPKIIRPPVKKKRKLFKFKN